MVRPIPQRPSAIPPTWPRSHANDLTAGQELAFSDSVAYFETSLPGPLTAQI
jgi:hypothetical protein